MRDAADRGLRLFAYLYFSDSAANWGNQPAPAAWAGKSVAETAALMEQHAYDTAMYFKSKGLDVEIYELGNETDIGMVDFLPNRRIPVPPGVDFVNDRTWLRENVWSVQATLLKAAIAGIRRAAPKARVAVHASSIESGMGPQMGPDFYQAMRDFGVDYDIAALSHPYAQGSTAWKLSNYSKACWFRRVARAVDQIAVPGKPVMFVEASYQSSPATLVSQPMPDFAFTPQGQADWAREQFRFASNHPSVAGWFYFYPEFFEDWPPGKRSGVRAQLRELAGIGRRIASRACRVSRQPRQHLFPQLRAESLRGLLRPTGGPGRAELLGDPHGCGRPIAECHHRGVWLLRRIQSTLRRPDLHATGDQDLPADAGTRS